MRHPPSEPLTLPEKAVFGHDAVRHPITGIPIEQGSGALAAAEQAMKQHLKVIQEQEGGAAALAVYEKLLAEKA